MPIAKILIVDDDPVHLDVMMDVADRAGYEVSGATSQEEAKEKASDGFDLIAVDIMLRPKATDRVNRETLGGLKVISYLRGHPTLKMIPIVAISTRGDPRVVQQHLEPFGVKEYVELGGQHDMEALLATFRRALQ